MRLNRRAGGIEGGTLAIPAIANVALLSMRLQMKLSRAIRVADHEENLELWIETEPDPEKVKLSIISWRVLPDLKRSARPNTATLTQQSDLMKLDAALRLVRATGLAAEALVPSDFGRNICEVLPSVFENDDSLKDMMELISNNAPVKSKSVSRRFDGKIFTASGEVLRDDNQATSGYELRFERPSQQVHSVHTVKDASDASTLFGKNLAPVLRQPLGRIIANAETIGNELQGPIRENYALYARDIASAARHLSTLVDDLGDLEAVEKPDFKTARDDIELGDVARRVKGLLALKAADHRITIHTPPESHIVKAVAEFRRTLQILLNLVNNAIRYSPDGTEVFMDTVTVNDYSVVLVRDQGKGIPDADHEKIFEKFERLGRSGDGGSGLGLYISRRLARAMGGELSVENADGGGAIFTLRLPNK